MRYPKLQQYFDKGEIEELLADCEDAFATIDNYKNDFIGDMITTSDEYKKALNVLTGIYMFFEPIFSLAQAYKEIKEDEAYCNIRTEAETAGKKLTADALKVEAHKSVSMFIRVRNIFESYVNAADKGIITCQTQLKRIEEIKTYKPTEERK